MSAPYDTMPNNLPSAVQTTDEIDLSRIWHHILENLKLIAILTLCCSFIASIYIIFVNPIYTTSASLLVETKSSRKLSLGAALGIGDSGDKEVVTKIALLKSHYILNQVIKKHHLNIRVTPKTIWFGQNVMRVLEDKLTFLTKFLPSYSWSNNNELQITLFKTNNDAAKQYLADASPLQLKKTTTGYVLYDNRQHKILIGKIGILAKNKHIQLMVTKFKAAIDNIFYLQKESLSSAYQNLLSTITIQELTKDTGIITVTRKSKDYHQNEKIISDILSFYIKDDVIVAAKEAQQSLDSLQQRLPAIKHLLNNNDLNLQHYKEKLNNDLSIQKIYQLMLQKIQELILTKDSTIASVRIIDRPATNWSIITPNKRLILSLSIFLGLILGAGLALIKEFYFAVIKTTEDLTNINLEVIATIPWHKKTKKQANTLANNLITNSAPTSIAAEAITNISSSFYFSEHPHKILLVTSATAQVGKTFVASNFACSLAKTKNKVLLIDTDLRRGCLANNVGVNNIQSGLAEYLTTNNLNMKQIIYPTKVANLSIIPRGKAINNNCELFLSQKFQQLIHRQACDFDIIIIDTAPVLACKDACMISRYTDANYLIVKYNYSTIGELHELKRQTKLYGVNFKSVILNGIVKRIGSYKYQYQYQYQKE